MPPPSKTTAVSRTLFVTTQPPYRLAVVTPDKVRVRISLFVRATEPRSQPTIKGFR